MRRSSPFRLNPPKNPRTPPEKGAWDLTFLLAMWYNNDDYDDYYKPVSSHPTRGDRAEEDEDEDEILHSDGR